MVFWIPIINLYSYIYLDIVELLNSVERTYLSYYNKNLNIDYVKNMSHLL